MKILYGQENTEPTGGPMEFYMNAVKVILSGVVLLFIPAFYTLSNVRNNEISSEWEYSIDMAHMLCIGITITIGMDFVSDCIYISGKKYIPDNIILVQDRAMLLASMVIPSISHLALQDESPLVGNAWHNVHVLTMIIFASMCSLKVSMLKSHMKMFLFVAMLFLAQAFVTSYNYAIQNDSLSLFLLSVFILILVLDIVIFAFAAQEIGSGLQIEFSIQYWIDMTLTIREITFVFVSLNFIAFYLVNIIGLSLFSLSLSIYDSLCVSASFSVYLSVFSFSLVSRFLFIVFSLFLVALFLSLSLSVFLLVVKALCLYLLIISRSLSLSSSLLCCHPTI